MTNAEIPLTLLEQPAPQPVALRWSVAHRIFFRFVCSYFVLYSLPDRGRVNILNQIPGAQFVAQPYTTMWHTICIWVGSHIFHLSGRPITYVRTGSGDTTLDYIQNLLFVVIALTATLIWSILDRKRLDYRKLEAWLRLLVRYTLAFTLFGYGFAKIYPLQFRTPGFMKLIEPWGDFSPMGALWSFMGASTPYIIFSGSAEVLGGLLLLVRRTALLGSLVAFGVMLNVMTLNYCYDVPVKLYSTNLVLMSVYLASAGFRSLFDLLLRNRAAAPLDLTAPRFSRRWARITAVVFQVLFVGYVLFNNIYGGWQAHKQNYVNPKRPPIYGLYEVENFTRDGKDVPPLATESSRWRKLVAEFPGTIQIKMMNDSMRGYSVEYDVARSLVTLSNFNDKARKFPLSYTRPDPDHLTLEGTVNNDLLSIRLKRIDTSKFLLLNRGFHWINEMPFNR